MTLSEYLEIVKKQIRQEQMREELAEELRCHVEDQAEVYEELGHSPEKAMDRAVADMGDRSTTGLGTSAQAGQKASLDDSRNLVSWGAVSVSCMGNGSFWNTEDFSGRQNSCVFCNPLGIRLYGCEKI